MQRSTKIKFIILKEKLTISDLEIFLKNLEL